MIWNMARPPRMALMLACLALVTAGPVWAATLTVTDFGDTAAPGQLRTLIHVANPGDTIVIPAGIIVLTGVAEDNNVSGDLDIKKDLTILGAGPSLTIIDGGGIDRVVEIFAPAEVSISDVAIRNGNTTGPGGGIRNGGTLALTNLVVSKNTAAGNGGGISSAGTLTLTNSTVSENTAGGCGGGIGNGGTLTLTNSTMSGNTATSVADCAGGGIGGGGIRNGPDGTITITNVTVSGNTAPSGGALSNAGSATLKNTILANSPSGGNCSGTFTSRGHNLSSDSSCVSSLTAAGDLNGQDALLGPRADNGGPTQTHALLAGSPAIDGGDNTGCPPIDQRGFVRPVDGDGNSSATCDIGAYELVPTIVAALAASVLPSSRSVQVGTPATALSGGSAQAGTAATAFATILNAGPATALGCRIAPVTLVPATFAYQTTDPATNLLTGTPNTPADIPAGSGQSFLFALIPTSPFAPTDVQLSFGCTNTAPAPIFSGLNTFLLSASATPVPDIVALGATIGNTGVVTLASVGAFAVATVNVGTGGQITAAADTGAVSLPVNLAVCQTNPTTGVCLVPPTPTVTTQIDSSATPTFAIFVTGSGPIPFAPATNRIFVRFTDSDSTVRGSTSVAVQTQPPSVGGTYSGSGNFSQTNCQNPANNGSISVLASATITDQDNGDFVGTVTISYPSLPSQSTRVNVTGSVAATGQASGTMVFSTSINNFVAVSGDGTFTGQVTGNSLALTFTGQVRSGEACHISGSLALAR